MRQYYPNSETRTKQKRKKDEVQKLGKGKKKERKGGSGSKLQEMVKDRETGHATVPGVAEWDKTERLNNNFFFF